MSTTQLIPGVIYKVDNLLPVHFSCDSFEEGAKVIPDNHNWYMAKCADGDFAFDSNYRIVQAKDIHGNLIPVHRRYSHFITGYDDAGNEIFFTDEAAAEANDFKFSLRLGRYYDKKSSQFYGSDSIIGYHNRDMISCQNNGEHCPQYVNDSDEYIIGLEVEKVDMSLRNDGLAYEIFHETGFRKETDSSLSAGGYELVSPKLPLLDNARVEAALNKVRKYINAKSDTSCGGHINISRKGVSSEEVLKNFKGIAPVYYALYKDRLTNNYCQAKNWNNYFKYRDKYSAFFLKNERVLEIRIPGRVTNMNILLWRVRLLQVLVSNYGRNINQIILKMSSPENALYKTLREQYTHERIAEKIRDTALYSERYGCGKVSKSIRKRVNDRFGFEVLPL